MLTQLTQYLLQFHQVYLPSIGTVRIVQEPATLDVASKLMHPPQFVFRFSEDGWLSKHQLWYVGTQLKTDAAATRQSLEEAGFALREQLLQQPFVWNGIGTLSALNQKIVFEPRRHEAFLQPVVAERVLRENVQHAVLQGNQMVFSDGQTEVYDAAETQRDWIQITGWAVVVLSLFFILFYLYQHQFQPVASGFRQVSDPVLPTATYQQ